MLLVRRLIHEGRERKEISRDNRNEVQEQSVREMKSIRIIVFDFALCFVFFVRLFMLFLMSFSLSL
jgi:hypothetical protein